MSTRALERFAIALGLAIVATVMTYSVVLAVDPPDSPGVQVSSVEGFTSILESGDLLVVGLYNLPYTTVPTETAGINFLAVLKNATGTNIGSNTLYSFDNSGYGYGVVSIYLTASETDDANLTELDDSNATTWPSGLVFIVQGNPLVFATVPSDSVTLTVSSFQGAEDQETNEEALEDYIMVQAAFLQEQWGRSLISESDPLRLSGIGQQYFTLAIPGLLSMVDEIFLISTVTTNFESPVPTPSGFASDSRDRYANVAWIDVGFDTLGTDLGVPGSFLKALLVFVLVVAIVGVAGWRFGQGGAMAGLAVSFAIVLPLTMSQGFAPWEASALVLAAVSSYGLIRFIRNTT